MYFVVAALILAALGLAGLADVYISGNKGAATISALLLTAAICVALCGVSDSVLTAMGMIVIVACTVGLTLLVVLWRFAENRKTIRKAKTKAGAKPTATPEQ